MVGLGIAVGTPVALASARLLRTQLHGVATTDPVSLVVAIGILVVSAIVAALVPARRASRVAPMVALRAD
jgi:ABC-type antimicrobial peptide transport system permease subunit